jgi:hypothetical protein
MLSKKGKYEKEKTRFGTEWEEYFFLRDIKYNILCSELNSIKSIVKYSRATSRVKWLSDEKTNVSSIISVLVTRIHCRRESYKSSSFPFPFVPLQRRGCLVTPLFL